MPARFDGDGNIFAFCVAGGEKFPICFSHFAIVIEIHGAHEVTLARIEFIEGNLAILVFIGALEKAFPGGPGRIGFAGSPAGEKEQTIPDGGRGAGEACAAFESPAFRPIFQIISFQTKRSRDDNFLDASIVPENGTAETSRGVRPGRFPCGLASGNVDGQNGRALVLVAVQDHEVSKDYRRSAGPKSTATHRGRQGMTPKLLALEIVTDQTEGAEVTDHARAVCCWRGSSRAALGVMKCFQLVWPEGAGPIQGAISDIVATRLEFAVIVGGQENSISRDAWR